MGLRCLLGHEYANREVEREREERGNEVVVTYRTVETCDRCGERRIVSENKEVRPVRNPRDDEVTTGLGGDAGGVTADMGESPGEDDAPAAAETEPAPTPQPETPNEESTPAASTAEPTDVPDAEGAASADETATDADETDDVDDAIILDDDGTDEGGADRSHGEWPEPDTESEMEPEPEPEPDTVDDGATVVSGDEGWPDTEGEDEGFDAEPSDGTPTEVSFGGGLAPERADETASGEAEAAAATNGTTGGSVAGKQFVAAEEVERVGEEGDGETEFFCPNCGYARVAGGSSMRAGDICPECHKGYIAERERS
ncbi:DUF7093 family protein [Haloplanus aerogenes]|nr:hypothetical protein [Haloplanus aerogenes]AZH26891.1 hypothetical protein DU502_16580 [Haloplanus aerogenes]